MEWGWGWEAGGATLNIVPGPLGLTGALWAMINAFNLRSPFRTSWNLIRHLRMIWYSFESGLPGRVPLCLCVFLAAEQRRSSPCPSPSPKGTWNARNPLLGKQFVGAIFLCVRGLPKSFVYALVSAGQRAPYTKEFSTL